MLKRFLSTVVATGLVAAGFAMGAAAQEGRVGIAKEKEISFQPAATEIMEQIVNLHDKVFYIIAAICILILGLLLWIMVRYNRRANPTPSKTSHNTPLEIIWTTIPILILVYIGFYSVKLLYNQDVIPEADLMIKVTGHQWYWTYEYPEQGIRFDSFMLPEEFFAADPPADVRERRDAALDELQQVLGLDAHPGIHRLLDTDTRVVVPVNATVKAIVTADDVIHAWTIPAFGFKIDAIPGRANETWFRAREIGTYYGQCSELCGIRHAFMPITVQVVSQEDFEAWVTRAKFFYASGAPGDAGQVAENVPGE